MLGQICCAAIIPAATPRLTTVPFSPSTAADLALRFKYRKLAEYSRLLPSVRQELAGKGNR